MDGIVFPETIPVILDDIAASGLCSLIYFCFEAAGPAGDWTIRPPEVPFLMLGLQGIVFRPMRTGQNVGPASDEFVTPDLIDLTLDNLEEHGRVQVETSRLLLPLTLLQAVRANPSREDVYRLRHDVFLQAFQHSRAQLDLQAFVSQVNLYQSEIERLRNSRSEEDMPVRFSEVETKAFRVWSDQHIAEAIEQSED